jgi:flagellar hook assembly protein FlgD
MIHYAFKESGNTATVIVFNSEGREMRILENNTLLSAEGSIKWDGLFENGNKMRPGIYMIYFKTFKTDGSIKVFKKVVTLAVKY